MWGAYAGPDHRVSSPQRPELAVAKAVWQRKVLMRLPHLGVARVLATEGGGGGCLADPVLDDDDTAKGVVSTNQTLFDTQDKPRCGEKDRGRPPLIP